MSSLTNIFGVTSCGIRIIQITFMVLRLNDYALVLPSVAACLHARRGQVHHLLITKRHDTGILRRDASLAIGISARMDWKSLNPTLWWAMGATTKLSKVLPVETTLASVVRV